MFSGSLIGGPAPPRATERPPSPCTTAQLILGPGHPQPRRSSGQEILGLEIMFTIENHHFPLKSPRAYTRILRGTPKIVFGHNLRYMALFDFLRAGFCMVFRRTSFVFSCPGTDFGGPGRILDLQVNILARGPFWPQKMVPKKVVLWKNDFLVGF